MNSQNLIQKNSNSRFGNGKGIIKDRLAEFKKHQQYIIKRRKMAGQGSDAPLKSHKLLYQIPPKWVEDVQQYKEILKQQEQDLNELAVSIQSYYKKFPTGKGISNQQMYKEKMENILQTVNEVADQLEKLNSAIIASDETIVDVKMRKNVRVIIAQMIQELFSGIGHISKQLQESNGNYSQSTAYTQYNNPSSRQDNPHGFGENQQQVQKQQIKKNDMGYDLELVEDIANYRDVKINSINQKTQKLSEMFRRISQLVFIQGTILDRIDFNVEKAKSNVSKGKKVLQKVSEQYSSGRAQNIICCLFILNITVFLIYILRKFVFN